MWRLVIHAKWQTGPHLPGYDPDVAKNRDEARAIMAKLGYGPSKRLKLKVSARDIPPYRDPAVLLIDQLKDIYIDAELELIETSVWYPKVIRKDFTIGLNLTGNGIDDPDQTLFENYAAGPTATTTAIATATSTRCSSSSRWRPMRRSARRSCSRSSAAWPRTSPGRFCTTAARAPAGIPTSRAIRR